MGVLLSIGGVADAVQRSPGYLRKLEREGVLPAPSRLVGSDRRVYGPEDVERIRTVLAERRTERAGHDVGPEAA